MHNNDIYPTDPTVSNRFCGAVNSYDRDPIYDMVLSTGHAKWEVADDVGDSHI